MTDSLTPCEVPGCTGDHSKVEDWGLGMPLVVHQVVDANLYDWLIETFGPEP